MRTDAERLELVLKFVNGPDVEEANQREMRENLASFLGYPLLADDQIVPDLADRWPDTIGGSNFEISAQSRPEYHEPSHQRGRAVGRRGPRSERRPL